MSSVLAFELLQRIKLPPSDCDLCRRDRSLSRQKVHALCEGVYKRTCILCGCTDHSVCHKCFIDWRPRWSLSSGDCLDATQTTKTVRPFTSDGDFVCLCCVVQREYGLTVEDQLLPKEKYAFEIVKATLKLYGPPPIEVLSRQYIPLEDLSRQDIDAHYTISSKTGSATWTFPSHTTSNTTSSTANNTTGTTTSPKLLHKDDSDDRSFVWDRTAVFSVSGVKRGKLEVKFIRSQEGTLTTDELKGLKGMRLVPVESFLGFRSMVFSCYDPLHDFRGIGPLWCDERSRSVVESALVTYGRREYDEGALRESLLWQNLGKCQLQAVYGVRRLPITPSTTQLQRKQSMARDEVHRTHVRTPVQPKRQSQSAHQPTQRSPCVNPQSIFAAWFEGIQVSRKRQAYWSTFVESCAKRQKRTLLESALRERKMEREGEINRQVNEDNQRARDKSLLEKANRKRLKDYAETPLELESHAQRRSPECDCDNEDDNSRGKRKPPRPCNLKKVKRLARVAQVQRNHNLRDYRLLAKCTIDESEANNFFPPPPPPKQTRRQRRHHEQRPAPIHLEQIIEIDQGHELQ